MSLGIYGRGREAKDARVGAKCIAPVSRKSRLC